MALSLIEKETIILFNEKEQYADVYVHDVELKKLLADLSKERSNDVQIVYSDSSSVVYAYPERWITIGVPCLRSNK